MTEHMETVIFRLEQLAEGQETLQRSQQELAKNVHALTVSVEHRLTKAEVMVSIRGGVFGALAAVLTVLATMLLKGT